MAAPARTTPPTSPPPEGRYFVALRPSARSRVQLASLAAQLSRRFGGRNLIAADMHLTLAFIGNATARIEPALCAAISAPPSIGTLRFERLGCFQARLLWTAPTRTPDWLADLCESVRNGLQLRGIEHDRRPLVAHLTLVRGAQPLSPELLAGFDQFSGAIDAMQMQLRVGTSLGAAPGHRYRWVDCDETADRRQVGIAGPDRHQTVKQRS
jgi:2'-5' RNA ligase